MENLTQFGLDRRRWAVQLVLIIGLALLFLAALLWGLQGVTPARADPGTLYVDGDIGSDDSDCSNPADPCASIGYALTQAGDGDDIRVAEGTYTETLDIAISVTLKGGYSISGTLWLPRSGETVVDADGADSPVCTIGPGNNVTIEGFTIQGANHTFDEGGGFYINGATVVISNTVIRDNSTVGPGSGLWIENSVGAENVQVSLINSTVISNSSVNGSAGLMVGDGDPIQLSIENTVFTENTGNDVLTLDQAFEIVGSQVSSNTATGPWLIHLNSPGTISGTNVLSNTGTALAAWPGSNVTAHNLTIRNNQGGAILSHGVMTLTDSIVQGNHEGDWYVINAADEFHPGAPRLTLDNCVIRDNPQQKGVLVLDGRIKIMDTVIAGHDTTDLNGDVINFYGNIVEAELVNVLVVNNQSARPTLNGNNPSGKISLMNVTVGGNTVRDWPIVAGDGNWTLTNSVLWGNTPAADMMGLGNFTVSYSDIENGWTGTGNLDVDPLFLDAAGGDYRLHVSSPVKDVGTAVGAPDHDLDGVARPQGGGFDMGAYEWTGFRLFLPLTLRNVGP
ncbi:MAG: hypothetical protein DRI81_19690 [Chloroflexi bacterium]|nr:MAG: hypothetical protein DRI81_19690 [Chloroflexota bacterium]